MLFLDGVTNKVILFYFKMNLYKLGTYVDKIHNSFNNILT